MIKDYSEIEKKLSKFSINDFTNPNKLEEYCDSFSIYDVCKEIEGHSTSNDSLFSSDPSNTKPYAIQYDEVCRLHYLCLTRKALNVLEFGSGFSTLVMANAQKILSECFKDWVLQNLRVEKPFHIYSVEEEQRYLDITRNRIGDQYSEYVTLSRSSVELDFYHGHYATYFSKIPNISPDLILLDGPGQFSTTTELNGFSLNHMCRMPMAADILKFEFFLEPGTLILVDGRTANARFLKHNLKMNWIYHHDYGGDIHLLELQEEPLGKFNERKLSFCLNNKWLLDN
jgi:hypothetical protein